MTKKEKEKKVLEALDLRVGDIIKENNWKEEYKIVEKEYGYKLESCSNYIYDLPVIYLIIYDFEVVEYHQKTYGEYKCNEIHCANCPLNVINCRMDRLPTQTLYECLDFTIKEHNSIIYKACREELNKACREELNKVVEDENKILD